MDIFMAAASLILWQVAVPANQPPGEPTVAESRQEVPSPAMASSLAKENVQTSGKKIADKKHPGYVRCRSQSVIGLRAKRKRTCMTNREWSQADRRTHERSLEFMGDNFAAGLY